MRRIKNDDIPGNLFKVIRPKAEDEHGQSIISDDDSYGK